MTVSVLVVDDSSFFRRRLTEIIDSHESLQVVGAASNGQEAIDLTLKLKPDVITMDYEMPVMDGVSAIKKIMERRPTPILMFSSLSYEGARITLDALAAGAVDYLPKSFEDISKNAVELKKALCGRIVAIAKIKKVNTLLQSARLADTEKIINSKKVLAASTSNKDFDLVVIGASTGGPVALQNVLEKIHKDFSVPIVLIQHMPATFTRAFAERLNSLCSINVVEAKDGDLLKPNVALLAPGGKQMMIGQNNRVKILSGDERVSYKPSLDITFGSAANIYKEGVLGIVLTGMGADGCEGARMLKNAGSTIWAQDKESSVIYGMPHAVKKANLTDEVLPLELVGLRLNRLG